MIDARTQIRSRRLRRPRPTMSPPSTPRPRFQWYWLLLLFIVVLSGFYISQLDVQIREKFEGNRWALPARVYARPLELYTGMELKPAWFEKELTALGYRRTNQPYEQGQFQRTNNDFFVITRGFKFWDANEISRMVQIRFQGETVSSISEIQPIDRQLALVRLEPKLIGKIYPTHNEDRIVVQLKEVPKLLVDALIAIEDRNFYNHIGISLRGSARALVKNFEEGGWVQGGSTITQQLVKNFFLSPERTLERKFNEAIMALLLEWHYTKQQILEAYLNEVYIGQDGSRSIHGVGMGAQFYFNRPLEELRLEELALLVSLVRAPSFYDPRKHPQRSLERRNLVLDAMAEQKMIETAEADVAKAAPLSVTAEVVGSAFSYPAFVEVVRAQLRQDYRESDLRSEGLQIFTTLDPFMQEMAETSLVKGIRGFGMPKLDGAMVVTRSDTGEILALVSGKNPHYAGYNRPLKAVRPIGSLVKAAIYLTALENSDTYSLQTILDDSPFQWKDKKSGEVWKPQNYDFRSHGRIPLHHALTNSFNLATVRLGMQLGLDNVQNTLRRMGIERDFTMYPSVLLGSLSLTPLEVAQMYQTIASGGFRVPVRAIREVLTHEGKPLQRYGLSVEQRFDPAPVYLLTYALQQVVRHGTGREVGRTLPANTVFAGKTGTSNDLRDSWFAGFGNDLLAVAWLGRDDNKPIGLSGGKGAMRIWGNFMQMVHTEPSTLPVPNRIQWRAGIPFITDHTANVDDFNFSEQNYSN